MNKYPNIVVTFDGGGKTGKTTTGIAVAETLTEQVGSQLGSFSFFSAGYLYRAVTYHLTEKGIKPEDATARDLEDLLIGYDRKKYRIKIDGLDVHDELNTQGIALQVASYSPLDFVRDWVNKLLLEITIKGNWIVEGRSMYLVFEDPLARFFFTCNNEVKAKREAEAKGIVCEDVIAQMTNELIERDKADSERKLQPLKAAGDSIKVDTSYTKVDEQVNFIISKTGLMTNGLRSVSSA